MASTGAAAPKESNAHRLRDNAEQLCSCVALQLFVAGNDRGQITERAALREIGAEEEIEVVAEIDFAVIGAIALRPRAGAGCQAVEEVREVRCVDFAIKVGVAEVGVADLDARAVDITPGSPRSGLTPLSR